MSSYDEKTDVLLMFANKIMEGLNQDIVIKDLAYLFDDDFYVTILSNILRNIDQVIGNTKEEKAANLNNLVYNLSQIVDMDLSDISGDGIIFEEDRKSVRRLLELILEIIYTMNDANGSEQHDAISKNEKILSDSNINHEEMNSELNYVENSNRNNRNSQLQNQILTSQSNSNFYVNESRDSQVIENENDRPMKSTNRSNKISNTASVSNNNAVLNNNLKSSKSNGFSNSNINMNNLDKVDENLTDDKILSNRNQNVSVLDDEGQHQYYDLGDHQLTNENLDENNMHDIVNHYEEAFDQKAEAKNMFINDQELEELTHEDQVTEELRDRMNNYSCIEFKNEGTNQDAEDQLSLNYLCNVLIQNNINLEEIQNLNKLTQIDFLKSFSKKAILSRKLNYSVNDSSRYILEKNDLQILIDFITNEENQNQEYHEDNQKNAQSIDFTSMLAGENMNKVSNSNFNENHNEKGDESKSINISRISEVSRSKENSDQFSNQKQYKKHMSTSSKGNNINFKNEDSSVNAKINSNSNLFKSSDANNNLVHQNYTSKYKSDQDYYQSSKLTNNDESKVNDLKSFHKNLTKNQIKELQSLGSYDGIEENNYETNDNMHFQNQEDDYGYVNHTDSMDMNMVKIEESVKIKNSNKAPVNNNIVIQNEYDNNQLNKMKKGSKKSLSNISNPPSTANVRPSSSNRIINSNKKTSNNKLNQKNQNVYSNNQIKNKPNSISNKNNVYNQNLNNKNKIQSEKNKIGQKNKNNGSRSEMSMSSIHSISHNENSRIRSNRKNYDNNTSKNASNNRIDNHLSNVDNYQENIDDNNIHQEDENVQYYDENGQPIQIYDEGIYQEGEDVVEENEAAEYENDEYLKEDILREFNRVYGNKVDKMLLRSQLQNSTNILDLIVQNVKLARNKMIKLAKTNQDPDDLATKEFFNKYTKELNYIVNTVKEEEKKRNKFIEKAVKNISHNTNVMKKLQYIEAKKIEDEINRRRKSRDLKLRDNRMRICEEIYAKALELEKNKHLQERQAEAEYRKAENMEKRRKMMQIEAYYQDRINILKETLRREKYEKEMEYKANVQYLSKLQRERRSELKKQIDEIFTRMDEEDQRYEFKNNRPDVLEKILNIYYNN